VAFYGASIVLALDFLHGRGVLHRDIKVRRRRRATVTEPLLVPLSILLI